MPNYIEQPSQYTRKSLPFRVSASARRITWRKAGYEGEALGDVVLARRKARKGLKEATTAQDFAIYSRELERWIERERILLRIPLPGVERGGKLGNARKPAIDVLQAATATESSPPTTSVSSEPVVESPSIPADPADNTRNGS